MLGIWLLVPEHLRLGTWELLMGWTGQPGHTVQPRLALQLVHRAGTLNLNIRYGQMTMALIAQAAIYQLRQRLGQPVCDWDAAHLAQSLFNGLDGDIRVTDDTILVTIYNAPHAEQLCHHYEHLPLKLAEEGVDPHIPWLYDFKLDFRFK